MVTASQCASSLLARSSMLALLGLLSKIVLTWICGLEAQGGGNGGESSTCAQGPLSALSLPRGATRERGSCLVY